MNLKPVNYVFHALAAMIIAASASACIQEELPGDETAAELESFVLSEQGDELATIEDEADRMAECAAEPGQSRPEHCLGHDPEADSTAPSDPFVTALTQPVDIPTTTPCNYTTECGFNQYCHPGNRVCNIADGTQCLSSSDCPAGQYCHFNRCHAGGVGCSAQTCPSGEYCHVNLCHADACSTDNDCPAGITCSPSRRVCRIP